ncbi:hypothetical protein GQ457_16G005890 [Hibiscus cannabinus]
MALHNSKSIQVNPRVSIDNSTPLTGLSNGRLPNVGGSILVHSKLERAVILVSKEGQQVVKRSRGEGDDVMDIGVDDLDGFRHGVTAPTGTLGILGGGGGTAMVDGGEKTKPSFRDMLPGRRVVTLTDVGILDLDVDMKDDDVKFSTLEGTPVISFSDRVHDKVDEKLAKSVVVRLLGRSIGYIALLNRIRSLWNPSGEMALVDLDNGYYLVRFARENDVTRVLIGGHG